jgi:hypothetical protein
VQPIGKTQDSATNHTTNRTVAPRIDSVMIHTLNQILGSLLRDDLNLKRYTKGTQSSISSISLIPDGSFSVIAFASTKSVDESECALTPFFHSTSGYSGLEHVVCQGFNHIQHFRYTGNGVNWMPKDTPGYFTLPLHLRRRIIRLSSTYQQTQILSLDNAHTIVGAMTPVMIDDTLFRECRNAYQNQNDFIIELKPKHPNGHFPDLKTTHKWIPQILANARAEVTEVKTTIYPSTLIPITR